VLALCNSKKVAGVEFPGEEIMTSDQVRKLRTLLERRLAAIDQTTATLKVDLLQAAEIRPAILKNGLDHAKEEGDLNARIEIHEMNLAARERLRAAINRLGTSTYGRCLKCDEQIHERRLEAQPDASHCLQCQSAEETRPIVKKPRFAFVKGFGYWTLREAA
jgi:DnaK suppressor protein